ncbi:MAG: hydroxyethylthiazole kinase [Pseudomonadota bacterium]
MNPADMAEMAGQDLARLKQQKPLVHNITNLVVMNFTANALLAAGASPVMAHAHEEVEEMVALAGALVLNIGTLTPHWVQAMEIAGRKANELGIPVILDPVGAGATRLRTQSALRLLQQVRVSVVRGNASEVLSLARSGGGTKGVDSVHGVDEAVEAAGLLARELGMVIAITGERDLITDGQSLWRVANGHALMGSITGMGCAATALMGAFLAVRPDPLAAAVGGLCFLGLAGQRAALASRGPGSFQVAFLDELMAIEPEALRAGALIQTS